MYVFKELNRKHAGQVRASMLAYLITVVIVWFLAIFSFGDAYFALTATIVVWLAVHALRVAALRRIPDLELTKTQSFTIWGMGLCIFLFIAFAYTQVPMMAAFSILKTSKSIVLSLLLASFLSVYVDFGLAKLLSSGDSNERGHR